MTGSEQLLAIIVPSAMADLFPCLWRRSQREADLTGLSAFEIYAAAFAVNAARVFPALNFPRLGGVTGVPR